ncbi:MAG: aldolase [Acidobacteria bacterium]|nr:aldolase [Acidobacteriota bacterium]
MDPLEKLCETAASFFARGYAFGSTGNLSVVVDDRVWITPTGASLRKVVPADLACISLDGAALNANKASKEYPFHLAAYRGAGGRAKALVHLHCTYAVALSCLDTLDEANPLPVFTPYYLMRVAPLAVLPYYRPGSGELAQAVGEAAVVHDSMLLRNHGVICLGAALEEAVDRTEELEETAKLWFLTRGEKLRMLTAGEQDEIRRVFRGVR